MPLADDDRRRITERLGREPTPTESVLFENLWSEHCAYRSSRPLLTEFESEGEQVVVGPGDDAAVVGLPTGDETTDLAITLGIESHNHPSFVDPYDGAATGVGGIVRDTLSMGAYPIALTDSLYFGDFDREHTRYLLDGVVEGIADYGNAIGVPTVGGSLAFHPGYEGNPLVNVACVGLLDTERLVTAEAQRPGNQLVLVGNATGRDGLGGASFASEDLAEDAETEDRPAVQVGDPYTEKLLIESNEQLIDEELIESARDLGAAGLGGASAELVAKGGLGADIDLGAVHQREPGMNPIEILLAESQERMCYEVAPENVERVRAIADRFDLGCSVIGEVVEGNYTCSFDGDAVVDAPAEFLADGAPAYDLPAESPVEPDRDLPSPDLETAFGELVGSPNTASREWVYRQYDHEVGLRTARGPGDDSAVLAIHDASGDGAGIGLALSAGAEPNWTAANPAAGARAVALENATNLAAKGATPLAAVDCLNGGNPENPGTYGGFSAIVDGLAGMCADLDVPVVGGNVSLYNDSAAGPIPPTPTLAMVGVREGYEAPPTALRGVGDLLLVGGLDGDDPALGGSEYLARFGGADRFPNLPDDPQEFVAALARVANEEATAAVHDVSHGGLAVTLAEMVTPEAGARIEIDDYENPAAALFGERPGRAVVETDDPEGVEEAFDGVAPVDVIGRSTDSGRLDVRMDDERLSMTATTIAERRSVLDAAME
ncbi:phosphoribosylformylglycinamidine synthase subunit PurL [Halococcus hamelinensis]|uniref:Phosphoribosylformylglycinamidine synthase subunit PurL n=1 Tax=Halococcus hamelinensis 100A6 TaxID=1132509 RepID=M0M0A8_9EURY|nr:phosphoribosylformylglycinamidine synthase subunit PurL [Halococcus hamelinensis]EMA38868.1 phosphoribosylformylglycinamidine synthase II [Halococcus hamelinensis 100A6]